MIAHLLDCFRDDPLKAIGNMVFIGIIFAILLAVVIVTYDANQQATLALSTAAEQVGRWGR